MIQKACTAQGEGDKSSSLDQQQFLNYIHQIKLRYLNTFQSNGSSVEIISQFDEKNLSSNGDTAQSLCAIHIYFFFYIWMKSAP